MKKKLPIILLLTIFSLGLNAQQCLTSGYCSNFTNQYPSSTFSTTSSTWTSVSAYMNAGNWTLFNVTSGNTYEWTYCEAYGGVSTNWDPQLTLINNSNSQNICFSDNGCGTNGNAPYISWTATYTGVVKLLTSQSNCASNTGSPYNKLVWRESNGTQASTPILGIDVSHYDGTINWTSVKGAGKVFAYCKGTDGINYTDPTFITNMTNGANAGVIMGVFHFARPLSNNAIAEAQYFLSIASSYIGPCFLPPALDVEDPNNTTTLEGSMSSNALTTWVQDWITYVQQQTGVTPIIYTGADYLTYLNSSVNVYKLWVPKLDQNPNVPPSNIGNWNDWGIKQYSFTGNVPGISNGSNTDLNVFNGDSVALNNLIGCNLTTEISQRISGNDFMIYPNPASNNITIELSSLNTNHNETLAIYNIQGQLLYQQFVQEQKTDVDVSGFANGIYFLKVKTENGIKVKRFVKK